MKTFLMFTLISLSAFAYIPNSSFVFDRVAELHGKGNYKITMDLTFKSGKETQTVKEAWTIAENGDMLVQAYGGNFRLTRLIKRGRVYWHQEGGAQQSQEVSGDSFMSLLFMKSALELKRTFVRWGALSPEALKEKKAPKELSEIKTETEPFVRLGRVNGAVQYMYGEAQQPAVWVEQDHFFLSRMRMPSGAEFTGLDYLIYSKNLAFPKNQTVKFADNEVEIKVTGLSALEQLSKEDKAKLEPTFLRNKPDYATFWPKTVLAETMQEFYKRFR